MGSVYSLFPSGYVEPTKTTTVTEIVNMPLEEQASFASKSVIIRVDDAEFAKKLLEMAPPEPITAEYLATLAAMIKADGEHAEALLEKYTAAAGKSPEVSVAQPTSEQKDTAPEQHAAPEEIKYEALAAEEKVIEKYVIVHYCPSCGKIYRGSEEDESESSDSSDKSTLSNSLD